MSNRPPVYPNYHFGISRLDYTMEKLGRVYEQHNEVSSWSVVANPWSRFSVYGATL